MSFTIGIAIPINNDRAYKVKPKKLFGIYFDLSFVAEQK